MRDIRFRSWNKVNKMMYDNSIYNCKDSFDIQLKHPQIYEVMQYIGLEDKNGIKIYEGDIITITLDTDNVITGSVGMNNGQWSIKYYDRYYPLVSIWYEMQPEVIGNIYENSELLERKNEVK